MARTFNGLTGKFKTIVHPKAKHRSPRISAVIVRGSLLCLGAGLHLGFVGTAYAQPNRTWTGLGADSQWTTAENWDPIGVPHPNLGDTQYTLAGTIRLDPTISQIYVVNKITYDNTAGAFTITNSSAFWVGDGGYVNNSTSTQTVNAMVNLFASQTWNAAAGDMVFTDVEMLFGSSKLLTVDGAHNVTVTGDFSGQAGVTKQGAGALLFSGTNTYTNGTTVEAGILRAGAATALPQNTNYTVNGGTLDLNNFDLTAAQLNGAGGTIALGTASLTVDQTSDTTFAGAITGTGGLSKAGTGNLNLTGANNYAGGTAVTAGTLSGTTNGLQGAIVNDANVVFNQSTNGTYAGAMSGTGAVTKVGSGTVTFTGANDYSGGTSVTAGTLSGTTNGLQGAIVNDANVVFDQSTSGTYAGAMSGTGAVTKTGSGTVTFTGVNSYSGTTVEAGILRAGTATALPQNTNYTVNGGTLDLNDFNLTAAQLNGTGGTIDLGSASLVVIQTSDTTFPVAITGTGDLSKSGAGNLNLTGANDYSGGTAVTAGTLSGTTTSLQGAIVNDANVVFNQSTNGTYAGAMSGTGAVTKVGSGTVTFTGANDYSGGTSVTAGTLSGTTTSLQGAIVNDANVVFDQSTNGTYAGAMSGTGAVTKVGSGTVSFTGANDYSGGTAVTAGTLSGTTTGLQGVIVNDANVVFDQSTNGTYAGAMSGTGAVTKVGSGTVNFTGANNYAGGTSVTAGTLSGTTTGLQGVIVNDANVVFDQSTTGTYAGVMSGTGAVTKAGSGTVHFTGANDYSGGTAVTAGTLSGTTTGLQGVIVNDANVVFDQSTNGTYAGTMSGTGAVTKAGSGIVNFAGANTYTGTTTVNAGTLAINGSINSDTTVGADGTLAGNGTIIGDVIVNGTTSAGNSIGTLGVVGNYSSISGSVTSVEIGGTGTVSGVNVDRVAVTGAATLNGVVAVSTGAGTYAGGNQYTFLTATTVSGTYSSITDDLAFFNAVLGYTAGSAYFTLEQGSYADMGTTRNTFKVGTYLDGIATTATGERAVLLNQLNQVSNADANLALQQLTGSVYGSTAQIGVQSTSIYLQALARRLRSNLYDGNGSPATPSSYSATMPSYGDPSVNRGQWNAWAAGFGSGGNAESDGNAASLDYSMGGMLAGMEIRSDTHQFGFYAGYLETSIDTDADESVDIKGGTIGSYFVGRRDKHYFMVAGGFEFDEYDSERRISFANDTASGDTEGWKGYSYLELGTNFGSRHFAVQPFVGTQYIYLRQNGFTETGAAAANLDVPDIDTHSLRSVLGARLYGTAASNSGRSITPEVRAVWLHEFLDTSSGFNTSFSGAGGGSSFSTEGLDLGSDWVMLGAGLKFQLGSGWSVYLDYDLVINDQTTFHVGSGGVTYSW